MVSEVQAKELIRQNVYKTYDKLGYGKKVDDFGCVQYSVKGEIMTLSEYMDYCIKQEFRKFGIK